MEIFILETDPGKIKEYLSIMLAFCAFCLSAIALAANVVYQVKERKRNIRGTLTNSLTEIARIHAEVIKLKMDGGDEHQKNFELVKNLNAQLGIRMMDADFLINENYKIVQAIDCSVMATAFEAIGKDEKANHYWTEAVLKSDTNNLRHRQLADYGSFLFGQNKMDEGRQRFREAMELPLEANDSNWQVITETLVCWAKLERNTGHRHEAEALTAKTEEVCNRIRNTELRLELKKVIQASLKPSSTQLHPAENGHEKKQ